MLLERLPPNHSSVHHTITDGVRPNGVLALGLATNRYTSEAKAEGGITTSTYVQVVLPHFGEMPLSVVFNVVAFNS